MAAMTPEERQEAINGLKQICAEIGCSGWSPDLCENNPHQCDIIRKIVCPQGVEFVEGKWRARDG